MAGLALSLRPIAGRTQECQPKEHTFVTQVTFLPWPGSLESLPNFIQSNFGQRKSNFSCPAPDSPAERNGDEKSFSPTICSSSVGDGRGKAEVVLDTGGPGTGRVCDSPVWLGRVSTAPIDSDHIAARRLTCRTPHRSALGAACRHLCHFAQSGQWRRGPCGHCEKWRFSFCVARSR
jgi:hypothetical protein